MRAEDITVTDPDGFTWSAGTWLEAFAVDADCDAVLTWQPQDGPVCSADWLTARYVHSRGGIPLLVRYMRGELN